MAAQYVHHTVRQESESVGDFIRHLNAYFNLHMGEIQTRDTGLLYEILKAPAVSGSQNYKELSIAAKNDEKRLSELRKSVLYQKGGGNRMTKSQAASPKPAQFGIWLNESFKMFLLLK